MTTVVPIAKVGSGFLTGDSRCTSGALGLCLLKTQLHRRAMTAIEGARSGRSCSRLSSNRSISCRAGTRPDRRERPTRLADPAAPVSVTSLCARTSSMTSLSSCVRAISIVGWACRLLCSASGEVGTDRCRAGTAVPAGGSPSVGARRDRAALTRAAGGRRFESVRGLSRFCRAFARPRSR
jgi:hypothetical protein